VKNQYFGDVNDYRKYGLLRVLSHETGLRCLVGWMLTPDDDRRDGGFTRYLDDPDTWRHFDPDLFDTLRDAVSIRGIRDVKYLEASSLLQGASFLSDSVPDPSSERTRWSNRLLAASKGHDLVFLDPDNGIEVKSKPVGCKDSRKYVYWQELAELFELGVSLLVYQHYPRRPRDEFTFSLAERFSRELEIDRLTTFSTSKVLFVLASQSDHSLSLRAAAKSVARKWHGQFLVGEAPAGHGASADAATPLEGNYRLF